MIIVRTPYRIPLAGGGTDHSFYFKKKNGNLISASFNQYVYCLIQKRPLDKKILIQTTITQFTTDSKKIEHPIIREVLKFFKIKNGIQVGTFATVPTQSGLGSSSALIVGLIKGITHIYNKKLSNEKIYKAAFKIERKILKMQGGWQDQIISTYGGLRKIKISKKGKIDINQIKLNRKIVKKLEDKMILVFTGETRSSSKIIKSQKKNLSSTVAIYDKLKKFVKPMEAALKKGNFKKIGELFHKHWLIKKNISKDISNSYLDNFYIRLLKDKNFIGGKIIGAGGGGFFLMITKNMAKSEKFLKKEKIDYTKLKFDLSGAKIVKNLG
jgi:D-glycero-alpha-D-manno-heptose-7-phosphate kinase